MTDFNSNNLPEMFEKDKQTHPGQRFSVPTITNPEKQLSDSTMKLYKSKLNKLAKFGIKNVENILANQSKVIAIAKEDSGSDNHKMRTFLSAVFWVLADTDISRKIELYNEFQRHKEVNQKFITPA